MEDDLIAQALSKQGFLWLLVEEEVRDTLVCLEEANIHVVDCPWRPHGKELWIAFSTAQWSLADS